jgi:hypothetical protein
LPLERKPERLPVVAILDPFGGVVLDDFVVVRLVAEAAARAGRRRGEA